ncbi:hypothetical protein [Streptacidiphilus sp. MAP12-33]|uniref:hypothetical protein n=1 Tax=Streptacidiphilus sp. MAP12-33 TaxID=3156266 RepID=UPI0035158021
MTAATVVLAVTGLAACGGGSGGSAAASGTSRAATSPTAVAPANASDAIALTTKAVGDYRSVTMKLTATEGSMGTTTLSGQVGWGGALAEDITSTAPAQEAAQLGVASVRMKLSGSVMYMDMGPKMAAEFQGKHWMKMDMSAGAKGGDASLKSLFGQSAGTDPATQLKVLLQAPGMSRVGTGAVNGVQAVHYAGTVDLKALTAKAYSGDSAVKAFIDASVSSGIGPLHMDVWVDSRNLPVEIHETAQTSDGPMATTVDYSDFSTSPLTVTPPPASDTFDMASMLSSLGH